MNASFNTLISYLSEFIDNKYIFTAAIVTVVVGSFFYIRGKAKSGFSISNKIFIFLIGYKKSKKNDLIDDIIDIEKFNFHYNTNAVSIRQINKFESWIREYELDFRLISKLKNHLNIENLKIRKINKHYFYGIFISIFIPLFTTLPAIDIALTPALLIKMENTGWFWINEHQATEYNFSNKKTPWIINTTTCNKNGVITSQKDINVNFRNIDEKTFKLICNSFTSEKDQQYISQSIKKQQSFFYIISVLLIILTFVLFKHLMSLTVTYEARKMLLLKIKAYREK